MDETLTPVAPDRPFPFSCHPDVPCFNACCRDLVQFLTPYDILRLKQGLGLSSGAFLERYTALHDGPRTGLPVVVLRPATGPERTCPFVRPRGCAVYPHRPSSCRIYPLARAVTRCRDTGRLTEHYALLEEAHCLGHRGNENWTAETWTADQGLVEDHRVNDLFLEIIGRKHPTGAQPLDLARRRLFCTALYDLDAFRRRIFQEGLLGGHRPDDAVLDRLRTDDLALLIFGHRWVQRVVFAP